MVVRPCAVLGTLTLGVLLAAPAFAHGGRFSGPGGRTPVRPPVWTRPPGMPPRPTTPGTGLPATSPAAPGSGIPTTNGDLADTRWSTWWALNRWAYLPERGAAMRKRRVTTGAEDTSLRVRMARERRALLTRQHIEPFLQSQLDPATEPRDGVRAAAILALAKVSADDETLERVLTVAESTTSGLQEREAAALAVGLLRRTDPAQRLGGVRLDRARTRLLALIASPQQGTRGQCFAAFSLGLLADQGYGTKFTEQGRLVTKGLRDHLAAPHFNSELPIALLTALGMQPTAGIPPELFGDLRSAVGGSHVYGRRWTPLERGHALTAYARLGGPAWVHLLLRSLTDRRVPEPVQRAARLTLGSEAGRLSAKERMQAVKALLAFKPPKTDPAGAGVAQIALGRVLNADLQEGRVGVLEDTGVARALRDGAINARRSFRGFCVLALALAARDVNAEDERIRAFVKAARKTMIAGYLRGQGDADLQSAYVIGIGLLRAMAAKDRLVRVLLNRTEGPVLLGRTAIAVAALEITDEAVLKALQTIATDASPTAPRSEAALALSIITGKPASDLLIEQLDTAKSLRQQTAAATALGQLDDPKALLALIRLAQKRSKNEELRALAVAVLGLLGDPEDPPSLFRLSQDANYIARTDALHEAFSLL